MQIATWLKGPLLSCACLIAALGSWHGFRPSQGGMRALSAALMANIRGGVFSSCHLTTSCGASCYSMSGLYYGYPDQTPFKECGADFYWNCNNDQTACVRYDY